MNQQVFVELILSAEKAKEGLRTDASPFYHGIMNAVIDSSTKLTKNINPSRVKILLDEANRRLEIVNKLRGSGSFTDDAYAVVVKHAEAVAERMREISTK